MIRAVIVSPNDLSRELKDTLLFRSNVERMNAFSLADVKRFAEGARPDVVVIDSDDAGRRRGRLGPAQRPA